MVFRAKLGTTRWLFIRLVPAPVHNPDSECKVCFIITDGPIDIDLVLFFLTDVFCVFVVQDSIDSKGTEDAEQAKNE